MNYCESCKYVDDCELAYEVSFCDDCKHFRNCPLAYECCCKAGHDIECNNGFEIEEMVGDTDG